MNQNKNKIKTIKATDILIMRDKASSDLRKYWKIISTENVISKKQTRNFDLKALLDLITSLSEKRIRSKMYLQAINLGINNPEFEGTHFHRIITLSELNERYVKLGKIPTINPRTKSLKGKKALSVTEELTRDYIDSLKKDLNIKINKLRKEIEEFNQTAVLEIKE